MGERLSTSEDRIRRVGALFISEGQLLLARSFDVETWYTPGGKPDNNESDQSALVREIREELNVDIIPSTVQLFDVYEAPAHNKPNGIIVDLRCYTAEYDGIPSPGREVVEIGLYPREINGNIGTATRRVVNDLKKRKMIE